MNYCIRDIPSFVDDWVSREIKRTGLKKTEFLRSVLERACRNEQSPTLFDLAGPATKFVPRGMPFKFVDLFAGIGGFRIGLTKLGGRCVFTSEFDKNARRTYSAWFQEEDENIFGDINRLETPAQINSAIPDHDFLAAGFPCQPFSVAGVSKKNSLGHKHGFDCEKQGNLFFKIAEIVKVKRPPVLLLENVKNLRSHDKKRTFTVIKNTLEEELGYTVFDQVVDASPWVPQHRERVIIVCFDKQIFGDNPGFTFPQAPSGPRPVLNTILQKNPPEKYILTDHLWDYLQRYAEKHRKKGNGFGYGLVGPNDQSRTLSARYYKDGSEVLIEPPEGGHKLGSKESKKSPSNPRRLTIREACRLMGFTDSDAEMLGHNDGFPQVVADTNAYKQLGNAVVPAVVEFIAGHVLTFVSDFIHEQGDGCLLKSRGYRNY